MAITRDLWLILRARDEASRIVKSFGMNVGASSAAAAASMTDFDRTVQNVATRLDQFAKTSMLLGTVMAGFGAVGVHFIKTATDVAAEYDRQVRHTMTQIDGIEASLSDVAEVGRRVARDVPIPFEQMQETLFFIFSSMNVTMAESEQLLRSFAKEAVAGQSTIEAAAKTTISIMNSLGLSVHDLTRIQDVQFQIVRKGIITYEELSSTIGRALPATARAGQSFETLGAMIAFMTRNGLSAAMAATSAARALESFAHPLTVKRLEQIGVKIRDAKGEFLPLVEVMTQMNKKMQEMSSPERAAFMQELFKGAGGTIQARRFWDAAFKNFGQFEEMMGSMQNSSGVFENAYATMAGSVAAQSELIRNKWMLIKEALGRAVMPQFLQLITLLNQVLTWFERLPEGTKAAIGQFILWGSVISIVVGAFIIFIGTIAFFVSSILAAGSALLVMLGIIAGLTAAFVVLTGTLMAAWKNSEQFRTTISDIGSIFKSIWSMIVAEVSKVKQAFEQSMLPPLERLWNIIEAKVLPAISKFVKMFKEEALPKIQEAGRIIADIADKAFKYIGLIINKILVPAIEKMSGWWDRNSEKLRPFLNIAGQLVKWLLIIGAIILASPIMILVTVFAAIVVVIGAVIFALKKLWDWITAAFNAVVGFFSMLNNKINEFVAMAIAKWLGAWKSLGDAIRAGLQFIQNIIRTVLQFILNNTWVPFWNLFGGLIKEVWGLIGDIVRFGATLVSEIIKDWIVPIIELVRSKWNEFIRITSEVWNAIVEFIKTVSNAITSWITAKFNEGKENVIAAFNAIKEFISKILNEIHQNIIMPIVNKIVQLWNTYLKDLLNGAIDGWKNIINFIKEKVVELKNMFSDAKNWLVDAGKNIVKGLIDGITQSVKDLRNKLKEITDEIPNWKGPRSVDLKLLMPVGQNIMRSLMSGIQSQVPILKSQLQGITAQIGQIPTPALTAAGGPATVTEQKVFNQNINVYTQEIDPRVTATELGFELGGRI